MRNLIFSLAFVLVGLMIYQPEIAFGQNDKTSVKSQPPKLVRYKKPTRSKRKKSRVKAQVDMSKVPRLIRPTQ